MKKFKKFNGKLEVLKEIKITENSISEKFICNEFLIKKISDCLGKPTLFDIIDYSGNRFKRQSLRRVKRFYYNNNDDIIKIKTWIYEKYLCIEILEDIYDYDDMNTLLKITRSHYYKGENSTVAVLYKNKYDKEKRLIEVYRETQIVTHNKNENDKTEYRNLNILKAKIEYDEYETIRTIYDYDGNLLKIEIEEYMDSNCSKIVYLPNKIVSYKLMKQKNSENIFLYLFTNPSGGTYQWIITDCYKLEGREYFNCSIKLLEPIFTSEMFEEMASFLSKINPSIKSVEINGTFFSVSQFDGEKISQISQKEGIRVLYV